MSFLAPLYLLGALAVAGPVLLHLIRRTPKGSVPFSSVMFLRESPPRITKRSRLENWPLLLLRSLALLLVAAAFSRPFLPDENSLLSVAPARRTVLLIDRSASMRREDLWQRAMTVADEVIRDCERLDQFALMVFDDQTQTSAQTGEGTDRSNAAAVQSMFKDSLRQIKPTWRATDLGGAIAAAADWLQNPSGDDSGDTRETAAGDGTIVLVSDLQSGADLERLRGYRWPADVGLDVRPLSVRGTTNAAIATVLNDAAAESATTNDAGVGLGPRSGDQQLRCRDHPVHARLGSRPTAGNAPTHAVARSTDRAGVGNSVRSGSTRHGAECRNAVAATNHRLAVGAPAATINRLTTCAMLSPRNNSH